MYAAVHKELCEARGPACAFDVVAIAASAGGIDALHKLLSVLPKDFPAPILVVQHLPSKAHYESRLDSILARHTGLRVTWAQEGEYMRSGTVFLAPQDQHLSVDSAGALHLTAGPKINRVRPAADFLFSSVAACFGTRAIAVVLSGGLWDGAAGAWEIARAGGRVLAQDEISSQYFGMPSATLATAGVDFMFAPAIIAHTLVNLVMVPGAADWLRVSRVMGPQSHARSRTASVPLWCEDPVLPLCQPYGSRSS